MGLKNSLKVLDASGVLADSSHEGASDYHPHPQPPVGQGRGQMEQGINDESDKGGQADQLDGEEGDWQVLPGVVGGELELLVIDIVQHIVFVAPDLLQPLFQSDPCRGDRLYPVPV